MRWDDGRDVVIFNNHVVIFGLVVIFNNHIVIFGMVVIFNNHIVIFVVVILCIAKRCCYL